MLQSITEYSRVIQNITEHYRVFLAHLLGPISGLVFLDLTGLNWSILRACSVAMLLQNIMVQGQDQDQDQTVKERVTNCCTIVVAKA